MATRRAYGDSTEYFNTPTRGWIGLNTGRFYDAPKAGLEAMRKESMQEFAQRLRTYDARKEPTAPKPVDEVK